MKDLCAEGIVMRHEQVSTRKGLFFADVVFVSVERDYYQPKPFTWNCAQLDLQGMFFSFLSQHETSQTFN